MIEDYGITRGLTYQPVCGSDGRTYSNVVYLDVTACVSGKNLNVVSKGDCGK